MGLSADMDTAGSARAAAMTTANSFLLNMLFPLMNCGTTVGAAQIRGALYRSAVNAAGKGRHAARVDRLTPRLQHTCAQRDCQMTAIPSLSTPARPEVSRIVMAHTTLQACSWSAGLR
jgi:uncharacterized protein GlcG (DUF336 family)